MPRPREAMPAIFLKGVKRASRAHVMSDFENTFEVVVAELGDDAAVIGSAAWARECTLSAKS